MPRPAKPARGTRRFVILTGLSGSGKSHAIRALEDLGYFCVDNLPTQLIPTMAELAGRSDANIDKVAIVVDVREGGFLRQFPRVYRKLQAAGVKPRLIFLEASHSALVRRFSETRRPHPLARDRSVDEGITEERHKMNAIRSMADLILDTSNLTVHELRDVFRQMSRDRTSARADMVVNLVSFGYKHGVPLDADLVFDVRCLPNPHFVERLKGLTGRDRAVIAFMRRHPATKDFIDRLAAFLRFALPHYVQEGKSYLTVAIGCTGGQHRSVMIAEALKKSLAGVKGVRLRVKHRDS
jgi:UPF0042 nucleotide-binding protein